MDGPFDTFERLIFELPSFKAQIKDSHRHQGNISSLSSLIKGNILTHNHFMANSANIEHLKVKS